MFSWRNKKKIITFRLGEKKKVLSGAMKMFEILGHLWSSIFSLIPKGRKLTKMTQVKINLRKKKRNW